MGRWAFLDGRAGAEGKFTFSCSSILGRGMDRLCWRTYQRMVKNFLVAWGGTRTQVSRVAWEWLRKKGMLSLGFSAADVGSAWGLPSSLHSPAAAEDQAEKAGQASQAGVSVARE